MKYGLILKPIEANHFCFGDGKLGDVPVNPSGDWSPWLPIPEDQNIGVEPMACTTFALLNAVEILVRQEYGEADSFSKRFLAYASGTTPEGNDPHSVAEALRTKGDVAEADWSYDSLINTWEKFYATPPQSLYEKALEFIAEYNFGHSWVTPPASASMMNALTYSPLTAAVYAWEQNPNSGYYQNSANLPPEHDVCVYGYKENEYWLVFDSYTLETKKLVWDFPFTAVKRYTLHRQIVNPTAWQQFLSFMSNIYESMQAKLGLGDYARNFGVARSSEWPKVRNDFLKTHPTCAVCGGTKKLTVHHKVPFAHDQSKELEISNLIVLCEAGGTTGNHHLTYGHFDNFRTKFNPNVEVDAHIWRQRLMAKTEEEAFPTEP